LWQYLLKATRGLKKRAQLEGRACSDESSGDCYAFGNLTLPKHYGFAGPAAGPSPVV
jgi:hypothetical protein